MQKTTKKILAVLLLLFGLPIYVLLAAKIVSELDRPPFILELLVYIILGACWVLPFKKIFKGIAR